MMKILILPLFIMLSCGSTKSNQAAANADSAAVTETTDKNVHSSAWPTCIKNKIDSFKLKEVHERPQKVVEYIYKEKKVYYVAMPCCDFFNEVFDENCNYLGAPDGGFTGKGDGKIPDFIEHAKLVKTVWEDLK